MATTTRYSQSADWAIARPGRLTPRHTLRLRSRGPAAQELAPSGSGRGPLLAGRAQPEKLDSMPIDLVAGPPRYFRQDRRHPEIFEIDRALTAGTHEMVVVSPRIASY